MNDHDLPSAPDARALRTVRSDPPRWRLWIGNALIIAMLAFAVYWLGLRIAGMLFGT